MKKYKQRKNIGINVQWAQAEYDKGRSWNDIAAELGTNANYIRRKVLASGGKSRSKSEAQKVVLSSGKVEHPTAGKKRDTSTKVKISNSVAETHKELSEEEKEKRRLIARKNWYKREATEILDMRNKALKAIRQTSTDGSKMEKWLLKNLSENDYKPQFHREDLIPNEKMILDIYIPELHTAIEIDGPSHFLPIYGEEALEKSKKADALKNALLIKHGCYVVRIKFLAKRVTEKDKREVWEGLHLILQDIKTKRIVSPMVIRLER